MNDDERPEDWATADTAGLVVPSAPRSVALVRRYVVDACVAVGWGDFADTVALLASEAATNAVVHAYGPEVQVRVLDHGVRLRVEVLDSSPALPVLRDAWPGAEAGRGLSVVAALAAGWGFDARLDGKTFWFEVGV